MKPGREVTIYIGGVFASRDSAVIKTVVGSCITACLRDPAARVGGMNHFMLPVPYEGEAAEDLSRFGIHAMELLIGQIQKLGGERARLQAKVFGGGHVLDLPDSPSTVARQNVRFIREFLATEGIPLVAQDVGGRVARQVLFQTLSGSVLLKRFSGIGSLAAMSGKERQAPAPPVAQGYGPVTLFDD